MGIVSNYKGNLEYIDTQIVQQMYVGAQFEHQCIQGSLFNLRPFPYISNSYFIFSKLSNTSCKSLGKIKASQTCNSRVVKLGNCRSFIRLSFLFHSLV